MYAIYFNAILLYYILKYETICLICYYLLDYMSKYKTVKFQNNQTKFKKAVNVQ